jgi:hypothetical protein
VLKQCSFSELTQADPATLAGDSHCDDSNRQNITARKHNSRDSLCRVVIVYVNRGKKYRDIAVPALADAKIQLYTRCAPAGFKKPNWRAASVFRGSRLSGCLICGIPLGWSTLKRISRVEQAPGGQH